ncbi:MAG: A24 family peptidase C-terminal domain-containing protein [Thermoplasmata archaeon]|nr:A24 family peptidase C-terminal domain-containing protein [Thermoplasmata archaeon]
MADYLSLTRLGVALAFMVAASVMDWRTRKVRNKVWIILGLVGMGVLALQMLMDCSFLDTGQATYNMGHFLIFVPIGIIFLDVFWDREPLYDEGKINSVPILLYAIVLLITLAMVVLEGMTVETGQLLAIPVVMMVFIAFFYMGIIRGGADAKALMALAIMFPVYPILEGLPLISYPANAIDAVQMTFPFAFLILMNAAILHAIAGPTIRFFKNLVRGDRGFPEMFLGYRMDIEEIPKNFVWPMEAVEDGEIVIMVFPRKDGDIKKELAKLKEMGETRIWVTPKDPFIIPMTAGIIFSIIIGNMVALFF